jgi:hypothetical protein
MEKQADENQLTETEDAFLSTNNETMQKVKNYDERVEILATEISKLTNGQRDAYDKAIRHISGEDQTQLIMFISGEGGTGKSFIIALIMEYTRLRFGKQRGLYGAAVAMAPTGCAANVIKGYTWQSCYGKGRTTDSTGKNIMSAQTARKVGEKFRGTRLAVLDEVSMINVESIAEISTRHQQGMLAITDDEQRRSEIMKKPFGGMHILFTGDLWQLNSIGGHSVFSTINLSGAALEGQKIWHSINEYSELTENYRFKNDSSTTLQFFLRGAREGKVDNSLLHEMNKRIVLSRAEAIRQAHPSAVWIAHTKESVAKFNKADFKDKVEAGSEHFRIIATHSSATTIHPAPGQDERKVLYATMKLNGPPTHIDLAIGTRVSCVQNLGTQIGKLKTETNHIPLRSNTIKF